MFEHVFFCMTTENAVKINNSPRFTAFTAKRCKKYAVKIIHRISYKNSSPNLDPGYNLKIYNMITSNDYLR